MRAVYVVGLCSPRKIAIGANGRAIHYRKLYKHHARKDIETYANYEILWYFSSEPDQYICYDVFFCIRAELSRQVENQSADMKSYTRSIKYAVTIICGVYIVDEKLLALGG